MIGTLTILRADGSRTATRYREMPTVDVFQKAVGGHLQVVPLFERFEGVPCTVFVNEKAKLGGRPVNPVATALWNVAAGRQLDDVLHGDVLVVTGDDEWMGAL